MNSIIAVFDFIYTMLDSIYKGIFGIIKIAESTINFVFAAIRILPDPLYGCLSIFVSFYLSIFVYKIIRKG